MKEAIIESVAEVISLPGKLDGRLSVTNLWKLVSQIEAAKGYYNTSDGRISNKNNNVVPLLSLKP